MNITLNKMFKVKDEELIEKRGHTQLFDKLVHTSNIILMVHALMKRGGGGIYIFTTCRGTVLREFH